MIRYFSPGVLTTYLLLLFFTLVIPLCGIPMMEAEAKRPTAPAMELQRPSTSTRTQEEAISASRSNISQSFSESNEQGLFQGVPVEVSNSSAGSLVLPAVPSHNPYEDRRLRASVNESRPDSFIPLKSAAGTPSAPLQEQPQTGIDLSEADLEFLENIGNRPSASQIESHNNQGGYLDLLIEGISQDRSAAPADQTTVPSAPVLESRTQVSNRSVQTLQPLSVRDALALLSRERDNSANTYEDNTLRPYPGIPVILRETSSTSATSQRNAGLIPVTRVGAEVEGIDNLHTDNISQIYPEVPSILTRSQLDTRIAANSLHVDNADVKASAPESSEYLSSDRTLSPWSEISTRIADELNIPGLTSSIIESFIIYSGNPDIPIETVHDILIDVEDNIIREADFKDIQNIDSADFVRSKINSYLVKALNELNALKTTPTADISPSLLAMKRFLIFEIGRDRHMYSGRSELKYRMEKQSLLTRYFQDNMSGNLCLQNSALRLLLNNNSINTESLLSALSSSIDINYELPLIHYELRFRIIDLLSGPSCPNGVKTIADAQRLHTESDPLFSLIKETIGVYNMCYHLRSSDKNPISKEDFANSYQHAFETYQAYFVENYKVENSSLYTVNHRNQRSGLGSPQEDFQNLVKRNFDIAFRTMRSNQLLYDRSNKNKNESCTIQ